MTTPEDVERAKREAVRGDVVTVRWVCKRVVGRSDRYGMVISRCVHAFTTTPTRADYDAREARARCPSCGGMLTQRADGCEVVSDGAVIMQTK